MVVLFVILLSGPFDTGTIETHRTPAASMAQCMEAKAALEAVQPGPGRKIIAHCLPK